MKFELEQEGINKMLILAKNLKSKKGSPYKWEKLSQMMLTSCNSIMIIRSIKYIQNK